jgi:bla regulator protein blaR1
MSFAVFILLKATLVCGAALAFARICRQRRASIRHLIFALAFAALAVIPVASAVLPLLVVTIPVPQQREAPAVTAIPVASTPIETGQGRAPFAPAVPGSASLTLTRVIVVMWLTGVVTFLIPVGAGLWQMRRFRFRAPPWMEGQVCLRPIAEAHGVRRHVDVLRHEAVTGPMTCGLFTPAIVCPIDADSWDSAALRRTLTHEIEHVARYDWLIHCLSRTICALYWFHPLVWMAWRQLRLEAERACDDAVLLARDDARNYASLLVAMAQRDRVLKSGPLLAMAARSDLSVRVAALLNDRQERGRLRFGRTRASVGIVLSSAAMLVLAALSITARASQAPNRIQTDPLPTFEVASVKPNKSGAGRSMIENVQPGGLWHLTNVPTRALIRTAYRVQDFQIVGAPDWAQTEHYDVVAKASGDLRPVSRGAPRAHFLMLRSLLIDRFKLKARLETRDGPVFALVAARADGKPGAGLVPAHDNCAAIIAAERKGERRASPPGERPACGLIAGPNRMGGDRIAGGNTSMSQLATTLSSPMSRTVLDRTGLSGVFNFTLDFLPDGSSIDASQNLPSLQTALQEQLGLKLEPARGPVEVLVIDHIERPTED